jgi:hypothetical protein
MHGIMPDRQKFAAQASQGQRAHKKKRNTQK